MINRQFYTMKFKSSRLKEFKYNISLTFDEARENGEIIALADNQILRSIRNIKQQKVDLLKLEILYSQRDSLKKELSSNANAIKIRELQNQINNMMFIPEYITIVMEHTSHYKYLFENGLILNNKKYIRFSSSASQSRVSTVMFCEEVIAVDLERILDNGRNLNKELTPSKLNAYRGLSGSSTQVVSTPRFCVVPDCKVRRNITVNYVTETDWDKDDDIEVKTIEQEFNLFDGQGLISYEQSQIWANELKLDYVPAQWCIRQNFIKGMLNTFSFHDFCKDINNGNYNIKTLYKDDNGNAKIIDLREIDVIISESQFKLWDSFDSVEIYQENCEKNKLSWGVSLYSPKECDIKDILKMNYQFNQTLNWDKNDIKQVCKKFVSWVNGVNFNDIYYTLLFLIGENINDKKINKYLSSDSNWWVKALMINHNLIKDRYIKSKIYNLIKERIKRACLGDIFVDGNFQTLVSDPYAMMQHVCEREVTGLLGKNEYYSNYWNKKNVKIVDSMRAPLTFRSEHIKLNLKDSEELRRWYKHSYTGIIVNVHGLETLGWSGADYDYDSVATTSDSTVINGVYEDELPVVYNTPKSVKMKIDNKKLYEADLFSFGSIIGSITNKSTSAFALLPMFDRDSEEYKITYNRIKMCTKLQSAQIDKAKIGREVKGIPKIWTNRKRIYDDDSDEVKLEKELHNKLLINKHPYFFRYLYKDTNSIYKKYISEQNLSCRQKFKLPLNKLISQQRKTQDQRNFIDNYYKYMPVIDSDCLMNTLCRYIESIDFDIKQKIQLNESEDIYKDLMSNLNVKNISTYKKVSKAYKDFNREIQDMGNMQMNCSSYVNKMNDDINNTTQGIYEKLKIKMNEICPNIYELVDYLIEILYVDTPGSNKDILWNVYGEYIFNNLKNTVSTILLPVQDKNGTIKYMGKNYGAKEVSI